MRRLRERRVAGAVQVTGTIDKNAVDELIELGWLGESARADQHQIGEAFAAFVNLAFDLRITPD